MMDVPGRLWLSGGPRHRGSDAMANNLGSIDDNGNFEITLDDDIEINEIVNSNAKITSRNGGISIKNKIDARAW
jgi:hypothetical protein